MALTIKDPETEQAVRNLARRRGVSMTEAVRQAVSNEMRKGLEQSTEMRAGDELTEAERQRRIDNANARMKIFYDKFGIKSSARSMTKQEMDDLVGYDERGMW